MAFFFGLLLVGWNLNELVGVVIALIVAGTIRGTARGILMLVTGIVVAPFLVFPLAALLAVWELLAEEEESLSKWVPEPA